MSRVLVTGISGTGKSSALAELGRRGYRVVDTDDPGWREYREYVGSGDIILKLELAHPCHGFSYSRVAARQVIDPAGRMVRR